MSGSSITSASPANLNWFSGEFASRLRFSSTSVLPLVIALTGAVLHHKTGDHGDARMDSVLCGIILYWALLQSASIAPSSPPLRKLLLPGLGTLVCGVFLAMATGLLPTTAVLGNTLFYNLFPLAGVAAWWAIATERARLPVVVWVLIVVSLTVSLWILIWNLIAQWSGRFLIESTIAGATQILYWFGHDASRSADVLRLDAQASGSIDVLLGCTGLPIFRLLLKIIIVDSLVLGQKKARWYVEAIIAAFLIMMAIGPLRVAVLTAAVAKGDRSFSFWHGNTGVGFFSALGFLAVVLIVGRLDASPPSAMSTQDVQDHSGLPAGAAPRAKV